ncbi:MAG: hypothetical protein RR588_00325 [Solibacillus sp.]
MKVKTNDKGNLTFKPYADECTTFENMRVMRFSEWAIDIVVNCDMGEKKIFTNTKPFVLYYDTVNSKILNTLQVVRFESDKTKVKYRLKELIELSDIGQRLKDWNNRSLEVSA